MHAKWMIWLGLTFLSACSPVENHPGPKHVLVIVSDDHSTTTLGAYGASAIRTPNLDRIAASGVRFEKAYAAAPICSASRQSLLTGKYPHATGVNLLFTPFPDDRNVTIAEQAREAGIATALIGKNHWNHWMWAPLYEGEFPDHGFDTLIGKGDYRKWKAQLPLTAIPSELPTRQSQSGAGITWLKNAGMLPNNVHSPESEAAFFVDQALAFIQGHHDQRSLTWLAFHEPHAPFAFPLEWAAQYHPDSLPLPQGGPEDARWVPEIFQGLSEEERRGIITSYYQSVSHMDEQVGRLIDSLEKNDLLEETLIVYLSDHGYLLNEHGRFEKHTFWEEAVQAPLLFKGSGLPAGKVVEEAVSLTQLAPTLTEIMGLGRHEDHQGPSLRHYWESTPENVPTGPVFSTYLHDHSAMILDGEWKYVFHTGRKDLDLGYATGNGAQGIFHRLYHLAEDPFEQKNLAYASSQADRLLNMQIQLRDFFQRTHPDAGTCPAELNLLGQLVWFCEPRDVGGHYGDKPERVFVPSQ